MAESGRSPLAVALSSASVYPLSVHDAFAVAQDLGYDGVEVMVTNNPISQDPRALRQLSERYGQEIVSIHAPTLLLTQQVWGKAWNLPGVIVAISERFDAFDAYGSPRRSWQSASTAPT